MEDVEGKVTAVRILSQGSRCEADGCLATLLKLDSQLKRHDDGERRGEFVSRRFGIGRGGGSVVSVSDGQAMSIVDLGVAGSLHS